MLHSFFTFLTLKKTDKLPLNGKNTIKQQKCLSSITAYYTALSWGMIMLKTAAVRPGSGFDSRLGRWTGSSAWIRAPVVVMPEQA